jgi:hypothetical protein
MWRTALTIFVLAFGGATPIAGASSLYSGPGPRPGPAILYSAPAAAPQLTNAKPFRAAPILVSGASAYRSGEFLYQDYLYDDHGARQIPDPSDPRAKTFGDLFSKPNGTYTYPTGPGYGNNAADLVELRVRPRSRGTALRITLNTLKNPALIAFSVAIGGRLGHEFSFPDGTNVRAPASLFLTVHPSGSRLVADLVRASNGRRVRGPAPTVRVDRRRRQITVEIPHRDWNPKRHTVRLAAGVGLWDGSSHRYLLPRTTADATHPGGAGKATHPAAFFNLAFRGHEPFPSSGSGSEAVLDAAWWRDRDQGKALAANDISSLFANVNFSKLARHVTDNSRIPRAGAIDRILASHFEPAQGANFTHECGVRGVLKPASCVPEYQGRLQPYAIFVPPTVKPAGGYGMTLQLHSLLANYNQYLGSRNQAQFGERPRPSIVITPEARGPDQFYEGLGAADVFEVWADVARHYALNPQYTEITGYSMGGIGTFVLGTQFPDLFAKAQPTVGNEPDTDLLPSLRNVPVLMWNNSGDELVSPAVYLQTSAKLDSLGYRYELDAYQPCASPGCPPIFPNHLELAVNDQFAPAAAFLDAAMVDRNPARVTYVVDTASDRPSLGMVGNHAYWVSGLKLRSTAPAGPRHEPEGTVDAVSRGFGVGDPVPSATSSSAATLTGGRLGPLHFGRTSRSWVSIPHQPSSNAIDVTARNISSASINVRRAHVHCNVALHITSDGPLTMILPGCGRVVHATGSSSSLPVSLPVPAPLSRREAAGAPTRS